MRHVMHIHWVLNVMNMNHVYLHTKKKKKKLNSLNVDLKETLQ